MCAEITEEDEKGEEEESTNIIAVMIVEKNVVMTKEQDRSLMHYEYVTPKFRYQNIGTTLTKTITSQREYDNRKIMAVTSLPASYRGVTSEEAMFNFFENFDLHHMKDKNRKEG